MDKQQKLERMATASLTEEFCPPAEQVAAYTLGMLTGNDQLIVAAHVRLCPLCAADVAASRPPTPRPRTVLARFLPPMLVEGHRRGEEHSNVRQFVTADTV